MDMTPEFIVLAATLVLALIQILAAGAARTAHVAGKDGALTALGAHLYFFGRLAYLPLYAFGVPYVRSAAWGVASVGLILIIIALFI